MPETERLLAQNQIYSLLMCVAFCVHNLDNVSPSYLVTTTLTELI